MKKTALLLALALLLSQAQAPACEGAQGGDSCGKAGGEAGGGIESFPRLVLLVTSQPAAKLIFDWRFSIPFLQGDGPLTRGNSVSLTPGAEITPVSLSLTANAVWTPIAFFQVEAGGRIGSGWSAGAFRGIGLNVPVDDGAGGHAWERDGRSFDGALWELRGGAALQGDVSAVFPGRWNGVVMRSFHGISYGAYTRGRGGRPWFFENDDGENRNGFSYVGNLLIGYRMPIFMNMAALLAEGKLFLSGPESSRRRGDFGDDMIRWTFSGLLNFAVTERLDAALIGQFRARRNFEDGIRRNWRDAPHFTYRELASSGPARRLEFHRVVASLTYRL